KRSNAQALSKIRDALKSTAAVVGVRLRFPDGHHFERGAHRQWELLYESELGQPSIKVEASLRPTLRPPRRVHLGQLLAEDALIGSYDPAFCYALDADEARAEKVRAAFTREAIRDLYDLDQLARAKADLSSPHFVGLVDAKLAELDAPPLREQPASFGAAAGPRRRALEAAISTELQAVLRIDEPLLDLDATFERFNRLWGFDARAK
ncbi:MAG TPA: nucleotidyl transferase AbiEii/AbiGii toxin family protein, partial [Polyangiaceae bacterium]|nr:nucleotidyl transferase AbiEii/AbiGii toxin family protein [Polyangiaceae bacterium]